MEMDAVATATIAVACASVLASSTTIEQLAQAIATAPNVLSNVKKEMTAEARVAESKKRAAQREKEKKLAEERAKQAELL
jgi:galactitol-specific phosphotransferase system IIB component